MLAQDGRITRRDFERVLLCSTATTAPPRRGEDAASAASSSVPVAPPLGGAELEETEGPTVGTKRAAEKSGVRRDLRYFDFPNIVPDSTSQQQGIWASQQQRVNSKPIVPEFHSGPGLARSTPPLDLCTVLCLF